MLALPTLSQSRALQRQLGRQQLRLTCVPLVEGARALADRAALGRAPTAAGEAAAVEECLSLQR